MSRLNQSVHVSYKLDQLNDLDAEMVRLLQQFMGTKKPFHGFTERSWRPPTDIYETADSLVVTIEIAGVNKDEIDIEFRNNVLAVSGTRQNNPGAAQLTYHQVEIKYGCFAVELTMPPGLDGDKATAGYTDGFLKIVVPKRATAPARSIDIDSDR